MPFPATKHMLSYETALTSARLEWLDLGKGIAILLVLVGHVLAPMAPATKPLHDMIYNFHMGLFLFFAGCTASISYNRTIAKNNAQGNGMTFLTKKATSLLLPYVAWCLFAPYLLCHRWPEFSLSRFLHTVFLANVDLWFLPCLLVLLVWFWGLKRLESALSLKKATAKLALLCGGILALFAAHRLVGSLSPWGIYNITVAYTHVFPFVAGVLMFEDKRVYSLVAHGKTLWILALAVWLVGMGLSPEQLRWLSWLPGNYYSQLIGIAASVVCVQALMRVELPAVLSSQLCLIGRYTLIIYLAEGLWLPFWLPFDGWRSTLLIFAACTAIAIPAAYLCVGFARMMEMHPLTRLFILGKAPQKTICK